LQVAVGRLRRDGRVRVIGKKQQMRYYPMARSASAPTAVEPREGLRRGEQRRRAGAVELR